MPKIKTRRSAKKRFKVTGTGLLLQKVDDASHKLEHKSPKRKRAFGRDFEVKPGDTKSVKKMLGMH